jgi:catechol 2,3-dioxygenase-like lactoylglutathione lyase family enzyme
VREGDRSEIGQRLCFVRDPDDYRIEIIEQATVVQTQG